MKIIKTERGWPAHFICASKCMFRRNTLLEYGNKRIVVSTVGSMILKDEKGIQEIGCDRYHETMAFWAKQEGVYWEADVSKEVSIGCRCGLGKDVDDLQVNKMHETVVKELSKKLSTGIL